MIVRLLIILPCLLLSCGKNTVIEEKFPEIPLARKQKEQASSDQLSTYLSEINSKAQMLSSFSVEIESEFKDIDYLFQELTSIDLLDFTLAVKLGDSEKYQQFYEKSDKLLTKIRDKNCDDIYKKVYELSENSLTEEKQLSDSMVVRKKVDQINDLIRVAQEQKKKIGDVFALVTKQRTEMGEKIDQASVNFGAQLGDRGASLESLQTMAKAAKSLADIDKILADPRIFNLSMEIAQDQVNGPRFMAEQKRFPELAVQAKQQAIDAKNLIDEQLSRTPSSQQEVENIARTLDLNLENPNSELVQLTLDQGVTPAYVVRRTQLDILLNPSVKTTVISTPGTPPPPPGPPLGPPPPPGGSGAALAVKPLVLLESFKDALGKINSTQVNTVENSIKNELNKLSKFYNTAKLENIKNALSKAKDPKSYRATYQKLADLASIYSIDSISNLLDEGGVKLSGNESLFMINLAKLKRYFSTTLFAVIERSTKTILDKRMQILKNHVANIQLIKQLDDLNDQLESNKDINKIVNSCKEINKLKYLLTDLPCTKIENEYLATDNVDNSVIANLQALAEARNKIRSSYVSLRENINNASNKTDFFAAIASLNSILAADKIDVSGFPGDEDYTIEDLLENIIENLQNYTITVDLDSYTYRKSLANFTALLSASMTEQEIADLALKLAKNSKDQLAKGLAAVLSQEAYLQFSSQFSPPSNQMLVDEMKKAVFLAEDGIDNFLSTYQAINDAKDELSSTQALSSFAEFFNPQLSNKIKQISLLQANILDFGQQLREIKNHVEKNPKYLAIKFISEIDENNLNKIEILSGSGHSLEEKIIALPSRLAELISNLNNPVKGFKLYQEALLRSISALIFNSPLAGNLILLDDKTNLQPIVNAFSLVFLSLIDKLDNINFNGLDDKVIEQISDQISETNFSVYANKFTRLKSALGLDADNYIIINKIKAIKNKILPLRPETAKLAIFIDNLLR